jgi:hypothetical protein
LGRSLTDLVEIIAQLKSRGIDFESLTEKIETFSPAGQRIFHIFAALAQFERSLIRERVMAGLKAARARGRKGGRPKKLRPKDKLMIETLRKDPNLSLGGCPKRSSQIAAVQVQVASLQATVSTLQTEISSLQTQLAAVKSNHALLLGPFVNVDPNPEIGVIGPNIIFSGANIHIVSGSGATNDNGNPTGLGNLIIGYDEIPWTEPFQRLLLKATEPGHITLL